MKTQLKGLLITITGASMWGFCAVAGKYVMGTKGVDPVWMVTLRLLLAGTILLTIAFIKEKRVAPAENRGYHFFDIWKDKKSILRLLVVAIFAFAAYLYGITLVGPLMGSVLGLVEPVVAAFASALLLKQVFSITDIIGIVAILGGVTILSIYKGKGEE